MQGYIQLVQVAPLSRGHDGALAVGQYPVEGARWADEGTDVAKEVAHHPEAQGQGRKEVTAAEAIADTDTAVRTLQ